MKSFYSDTMKRSVRKVRRGKKSWDVFIYVHCRCKQAYVHIIVSVFSLTQLHWQTAQLAQHL